MQKPSNLFLYFAAASVNLLSFGMGIAYGWASPAIPKLNGQVHPESNPLFQPTTIFEDSWIASFLSLGAFFGPLLSAFLADRIGRKKTLLYLSFPMLLSHVIMIFATTVLEFYLARFLLGVTVGTVFSVVPVYLSEISEKHNRGFLGLFLGMNGTGATLIVSIVGPYISIRLLSMLSLVPSLLFLVLFGFFVPETPYYYILINKNEEAEASLMKIRRKSDVKKELLEVIQVVEESRKIKKSVKELFRSKTTVKGLVICICLMMFQQFTGILALVSYLQTIFDTTGSSIPGEVSVMIIQSIQVITAIVTSMFVDKVGRKTLLLVSEIGVVFSITILGAYFYLQSQAYDLKSVYWLPIVCMVVYMIAFNVGFGPLVWTIVGEVFTPNVKSIASTISTCTCIALGFVISLIFPILSQYLGMAGTLWMFSVLSVCGVVFLCVFVPETKGKSFLEIQDLLKAKK